MGVPKSLGKSRHKHHPKVRGPVSGNLVGILDGCVLHLPMDEGFGDTCYDRSGYGNHGTIKGATWEWDQRFGPVLRFDGIDDYVEVQDDPSLRGMRYLTVCVWFRTADASDMYQRVVNYWNHGGYLLYLYYGNTKVRFYVNDGANEDKPCYVESTSDISADEWYFVCGVADGANIRIFVNGKEENSRAWSGVISFAGLIPSLEVSSKEYPFNGTITEVCIYNRVRTPDEVSLSFSSHPFSTPHIKGRVFLYSVSR